MRQALSYLKEDHQSDCLSANHEAAECQLNMAEWTNTSFQCEIHQLQTLPGARTLIVHIFKCSKDNKKALWLIVTTQLSQCPFWCCMRAVPVSIHIFHRWFKDFLQGKSVLHHRSTTWQCCGKVVYGLLIDDSNFPMPIQMMYKGTTNSQYTYIQICWKEFYVGEAVFTPISSNCSGWANPIVQLCRVEWSTSREYTKTILSIAWTFWHHDCTQRMFWV